METNNYKEVLSNIFEGSAITQQDIDEAASTILTATECETSSFDLNLESMIDLLLQSGDSCLTTNESTNQSSTNAAKNDNNLELNVRAKVNTPPKIYLLDSDDDNDLRVVSDVDDVDDDDELEGAVGFTPLFHRGLSDNDLKTILNVFPDICTNFLTRFGRERSHLSCFEIIDELSQMDYKRREIDPLDMWEDLKQILPNADPIYLRNQARVLCTKPLQHYEVFLKNAIDNNDYPTMQDYLKKQQRMEEIDLYGKKFSVSKYLEVIPNPIELYSNSEHKSIVSEQSDEDYVLNFFYNQFPFLRQRDIKNIFLCYDKHLVKTKNKLKLLPKAFRHPRELFEENECENIKLLQEIAFLKHETAIRQFVKRQNDKYCEAFEEATNSGLLRTCLCCFDDQLIPEECLFCNKNCVFCKNCVKLGAEHVIGEGKTDFPCLADCKSHFDYSVLKMVLNKNVFQRLCQRKQIEEIKSANIEGLETCPFCDFSMVPAEGDKIFKCGNIECMKESCRECRHISHIPLRCSEIEYDEDVKMRTFIEDKMTDALLRTCSKCSRRFYKESGCNKMTCQCGTKMCYICGQTVTGYEHFGTGSRCPLYTENLQAFHLDEVMKGAQAAKSELGVNNNPTKLKFDPAKNLEQNIK